jgi:hypothetical protein
MANNNFYRTKQGILINLNHIISISPRSAAHQMTKSLSSTKENWKDEMLCAGFTAKEIEKIRDTAPYGEMVVTHTDSYGRYTKTTVEPIGYYVVNTLGVDGGGMSTYGRSIIITYEDYENILEILDF